MNEFGLHWYGKADAIKEAELPPVGKLRFCEEVGLDGDATNNLLIEGDNLEVLKLLLATYEDRIDMIYIDPPYNTGQDFVYKDRDRSHSDWLNMMYPRLALARRLLRNDGVIFISINEIEVHHLRCVMDEIFGEDNFIETFLWTRTNTPPSLSVKSRKTVEYILCYEKVRNNRKYKGERLENGDAPLLNTGNPITELTLPAGTIRFHIADDIYPKGKYEKVELLDDLTIKDGVNQGDCRLRGAFKWSQERVLTEVALGTYFLVKSKRFSIRFQRVESDKYKAPTNRIDAKYTEIELNRHIGIGTNETASQELEMLGLGGIFDYPKPVSLIQHLIRFSVRKEAIILDFFAGSGTTAEAVLSMNQEDGGKRSFICIQLPEVTKPESAAFQAGYMCISDITKERIKRVIYGTQNTAGMGGGIKVYKHVQSI